MPLLHAERDGIHLMLGCNTDFSRRSVGYVGASDGWRDLMENKKMDWQYCLAEDGNVAMTGEIDLQKGFEFTLAVSLGFSSQSAATGILQAFACPFGQLRDKFVRLSQHVLMAHEDKTFTGATVASMSIPWGETKDDSDRGGYHLVWARDMMQTTTALLACGQIELPLRALVWLACVQGEDGGMPQNSQIDGTPFWSGVQLDEVAAPIILAWRLKQSDALGQFDPTTLARRAVRFLILNGPVTAQERWEENSGYSPSTLAAITSALVCAADLFGDLLDDSNLRSGESRSAEREFLLDYADWIVASLDAWTVTDCGELVENKPRHFIRITPEHPHPGPAAPAPNTAMIRIANGGGEHPARNVVDAGFLQLVRMGIRAADDPTIVDSVAVVDAILKHDLPHGPCWRRYNHDGYGQNHDGYGQHDDGTAFDGTGVGRCWPLLTGERGHYEIAAGRSAKPYVEALKQFASQGGLFAEQIWDADDIPEKEMRLGKPAGSAMP